MMNYRMLSYLFGIIALIEAALLTLPLLVALIYKESVTPFLFTIGILLVIGLPLIIKKHYYYTTFHYHPIKDATACYSRKCRRQSA